MAKSNNYRSNNKSTGKGNGGYQNKSRNTAKEAMFQRVASHRTTSYNETNIKPVTSFGWPTIAGTAVTSWNDKTMRMPGIYMIDFVPSFGFSKSKTDPVNVAALRNFAYIRTFISGSRSYTPADVMIYTMSVAGLVPHFMAIRRALTLYNSFDANTRYTPKALITAMGINYQDLVNHYANYVGRFNNLAAKFNKMPVPANIAQADRWAYLSSNIFKDSASTKGQFYMYRPTHYPVFKVSHMLTNLPCVEMEPVFGPANTGVITLSAYMDKIDAALNRLLNATYLATMMGDILSCYTADGCYQLGAMQLGDTMEPVCDDWALRQIHNVLTIPSLDGVFSSSDVSPLTSNLTTISRTEWLEKVDTDSQDAYIEIQYHTIPDQSDIATMYQSWCSSALFDIDESAPDWQTNADLARLKCVSGDINTDTDGYTTCDVHVVSEVYTLHHIFTLKDDGSLDEIVFSGYLDWSYQASTNKETLAKFLQAYSSFDWAPLILRIDNGVQLLAGEIDNHMFVTAGKLREAFNYLVQDDFSID